MTGTPTAGTYTIHFNGKSTVIQWNSTWSAIDTLLAADHGSGAIQSYNRSWPSQRSFDENYPLGLIFRHPPYGETDVALATFTDNLTGGTINPPATVTRTSKSSYDATDDMYSQTTAEMKTEATYEAGWDFDNVWYIDEGSSYPLLRTAVGPNAGNPTDPDYDLSYPGDIHIFGSTVDIAPLVIADSNDNVLIEGDLEIQGTKGDLEIQGTILSAANATGTFADIVTGGLTLSDLAVDNGIVFTDANGLLDNEAAFTWDGSLLDVTGSSAISAGNTRAIAEKNRY
jgi:hypothetical protein